MIEVAPAKLAETNIRVLNASGQGDNAGAVVAPEKGFSVPAVGGTFGELSDHVLHCKASTSAPVLWRAAQTRTALGKDCDAFHTGTLRSREVIALRKRSTLVQSHVDEGIDGGH